jgi:hypothetical protein
VTRRTRIEHVFVDVIPEVLAEGKLYLSILYATAVHLCLCGCGHETVTPLSPTDWRLTFDGETVSLDPSVGNWSFDCQSHYWILRNRVHWSRRFSRELIEVIRRRDAAAKRRYFREFGAPDLSVSHNDPARVATGPLRRLLRSLFRGAI